MIQHFPVTVKLRDGSTEQRIACRKTFDVMSREVVLDTLGDDGSRRLTAG